MSRRVSRRTLLRGTAAAGALVLSPWFMEPAAAAAQDLTGGTIANFIGKGLANGVVGAVGNMAFGQVMQAMGFDLNGQAAMAAKLDLIVAKLDQLQNTLDNLQVYLEQQLSGLKYNVAYARVAPLIDTNKTITRLMQTMLEVDAKAHPVQVFDLKNKINALVRTTEYQNGLATWNDALIGGNGQTSLLGAWGSVVFNQDPHFFNTAQAAKIQDRWDSFDAQQAITVWCLVEGYNSGLVRQPELALKTLREWWGNRHVQLGVLRGSTASVDTFDEVDGNRTVTVTTKMNFMPPDTLYSKATQKLWMLTPYGPARTDDSYGNVNAAFRKWVDSSANKTGIGARGARDTAWQVATDDDLVKLAIECGGSMGPGNDSDTFASALQQHGFHIPGPAGFKVAGQCRWQGSYGYRALCNVFVEGDNWDPNGRGPAYFLANRPIYPNDKFFYT